MSSGVGVATVAVRDAIRAQPRLHRPTGNRGQGAPGALLTRSARFSSTAFFASPGSSGSGTSGSGRRARAGAVGVRSTYRTSSVAAKSIALSPAAVARSGSAPFSRSSAATYAWPSCEAFISAVMPFSSGRSTSTP